MPILHPEVEAAPLGDLRALEERQLRNGLLVHASRSALYRARWREAGIDPGAIRTLEDLQRLPYIRGVDLREVWQHHPHDVLCDPDVRIWFATSGTTGAPKWTPYGRQELAMFEEVVLRVYHMTTTRQDAFRIAIFGTPAPFVSDAAAYALLAAHVAARLPVEYILSSPTQAAVTLAFLADHRPTAVIGFPSLLLRIAEGIAAEAPQAARTAWRDEPSLRTFAGVVATRMLRLQARHLYRPEIGLFGGEPLAPYRRPLLDAWGLRAYELYAMTEYPCFHVECPEQSGIHLWADWCIPEIIPLEALDREEADGSVPAAIHLFDAAPGALGEFVFTSFARALPLVRYRTGDVIEVLAVARCGCGRTHPRIRVRGRRDDLVNLGLIRFSTAELDQRLGALGGITNWQLRIVRRGYKPQPMLYLVPTTGADPAEVTGAAGRALNDIDVLRLGIENGLVLPVEVKAVPQIDEVRTWSGKRRRVIEEAPS